MKLQFINVGVPSMEYMLPPLVLVFPFMNIIFFRVVLLPVMLRILAFLSALMVCPWPSMTVLLEVIFIPSLYC